MSNALHRNKTEQDSTGPFAAGEHFRHGLPIRRQAQQALAVFKPAQMPLLLDALDDTATPVVEHLEPFAWVVPEFEEFRATRTIGPTLAWWSEFYGQSAESLLVHSERYFCFGPEGSAIGAMEEHAMLGMYGAYRCTSGATADRYAYYASEEMTAHILTRSETSAEVSVTPENLPSPSGVAYLSRPEGGLVLLWKIQHDTLLSVQLVSASELAEFLGNDGEPRAGAAYRYVNHVYLPIPTAEVELSPPGSGTPPGFNKIGGLTPVGMDSDVPHEALTNNRRRTSAEILEVFVAFTHMLRQRTTQTESTTVSAANSATTARRKKPTQITHMSYRTQSSMRTTDDETPTRTYTHS
ncbi:hypothetical protein R4282_08565 [Rhodococcus oxybenzonivorans]|uniref:hypothetical protein n=1 Tax=Rhodococcus TaxID=1827 RepID=UPI0013202D16|nr:MULTISPECIES: hypothetical protein [Rhodococcus]MDV7353058.1 hypothetical protein [Rhodococcus oxybenzonivorans]QHE68134.1 hypothetical protein GFS60_01651 [Rhodococcus sp. WAY2]